MNHISCFSGIGGLEGATAPLQVCEQDSDCQLVLSRTYPSAEIHGDIRTFRPMRAEVVAGGWPCQDISIAGSQAGLSGARSGLLFELLRVSREAGASTLVAENVANLLRMNFGQEFQLALDAIHDSGFPFISWRVLNARDFGLPQHRTRLILIASKSQSAVESLLRETPPLSAASIDGRKKRRAAGFYWTAGTHSINYSPGYSPTLKVGSGLRISSPPAVHYGNVIRALSPAESLRLQGFSTENFSDLSAASIYRMAGNAVAKVIGQWVFQGLEEDCRPAESLEVIEDQLCLFPGNRRFEGCGRSFRGEITQLRIARGSRRACNLIDFIDKESPGRLSARASSGLLRRVARSGQVIPAELLDALQVAAATGGC
jgi:DNA (cytosine-5)-methyltransferase 1